MISIHAPREGCDPVNSVSAAWQTAISIHAPREGCDHFLISGPRPINNFNPRTPRGVRRGDMAARLTDRRNFNPRPPRGVRPPPRPAEGGIALISIHAPREGCDVDIDPQGNPIKDFNPRTPRGVRPTPWSILPRAGEFQSTHPARGATANFTKEQRVCLAQFAYLHKGKKAEHTKTNAPMLH